MSAGYTQPAESLWITSNYTKTTQINAKFVSQFIQNIILYMTCYKYLYFNFLRIWINNSSFNLYNINSLFLYVMFTIVTTQQSNKAEVQINAKCN
jgi:hypothetical protein